MVDKKQHPTYTIVDNEKDADATAWGFYEPGDKMEKIYFKFPEIDDHEIRIKTTYSGLCHSDAHSVRNEWGKIENRPLVPGHEILGVIVKLGKNVTGWNIGEKAGFGCIRDFCGHCETCKDGHDQCCMDKTLDRLTYGNLHWGGYADHVQQPAKLFFKIPEGIPDEVVPPLFCAGVTSYSPMKKHVKKGDKVALLGVGGVGHMAVQYLNKWGAHVTAFTTSSDKIDLLKQLGAHDVVVTSEEGAVEKLAWKFDALFNFLPIGETKEFQKFFATIKPVGTFVQIGAPPVNELTSLWLGQLVMHEITLVGSAVGPKARIIEMLEFTAKHKTYPMVEVFDFNDFPKAYDRLVNGKPKFRCVVKFNHNL